MNKILEKNENLQEMNLAEKLLFLENNCKSIVSDP